RSTALSYVVAAPGFLASAASGLGGIRSGPRAADNAAAPPTTRAAGAPPAERSESGGALVSGRAAAHEKLSAQVSAFHAQFVGALSGAGAGYAGAEAANASPLQAAEREVLRAVNAPTQALFDRPLVGNGTDGTAMAPNGTPGGYLYGNG